MAKQVWTVEDKASQKIADTVSDIRLNMSTVGEIIGVSQPVEILERLNVMTEAMNQSRMNLREQLGYNDIENVNRYPTDFVTRCRLLSEFHDTHFEDATYDDLFTFADLGFPAAIVVTAGICKPNDSTVNVVDEAWGLLLAHFGMQDAGFTELNQITG